MYAGYLIDCICLYTEKCFLAGHTCVYMSCAHVYVTVCCIHIYMAYVMYMYGFTWVMCFMCTYVVTKYTVVMHMLSTSYHSTCMSCQRIRSVVMARSHHEKLLIPATGIQFIPVLHTGIWHARENKFHTRESLFIFPCAPREYEY